MTPAASFKKLTRPSAHLQLHTGDDTLLLSSLGVGTYMGDEDAATDEAQLSAILYSVMRGWNVLDTGARLCARSSCCAVLCVHS